MKKKFVVGENIIEELTYEDIIKKYAGLVKNSIKPYVNYCEEDDLKQIVYLALWKSFKNYNIEKPVAFGYFANIYIRHELSNYFRYQRSHNVKYVSYNEKIIIKETKMEMMDIIESEFDEILDSENRVYTKYLLDNLTEQQRTIMSLSLKGYMQKEISKITGIEQGWISRSLTNSKKKMHKLLEKDSI